MELPASSRSVCSIALIDTTVEILIFHVSYRNLTVDLASHENRASLCITVGLLFPLQKWFCCFRFEGQGPVYTKRHRQCCDSSAMMLVVLFSLKITQSLQNGIATHFQVTPLLSMRTESLGSSESSQSSDASCKRVLRNVDRDDTSII